MCPTPIESALRDTTAGDGGIGVDDDCQAQEDATLQKVWNWKVVMLNEGSSKASGLVVRSADCGN